jgi:hypothetical protein
MAVILYPSGVTETYEPKAFVFTDEEILHIFKDYEYIRTSRLLEVQNTWCVWGQTTKTDDADFNKLGSDIIQENMYCALMFIHDTQIDPAWMLTDNILYTSYDQFKVNLLNYFDRIAENVLKQTQKTRETQGKNTNLVFLNTIGPTSDKRVLFEFDPHKQSQEFYEDNFFISFADKVKEFLQTSYQIQDIFYLYHNKKTLIFIKDENVEFLITKILEFYKKMEKYEYCQDIKMIYEKWKSFKNKKTNKRK